MEFIKPSEQFDLKGFYLEITSKCNLRCLHCYNESGILKNEISFELFKRLIDEFDEKPDITFSGGEPLLHPDIWKMLEYAQDKINNDSVLITNATLITDEIAKKLTASGIGVQVSLNGINAEQHDAICGKGNYEKTLRGLDRLLEAGNKKIIVRGMISKLNYKDAENFVLHWGQNAGHVVVSFLSAMGRGKSIKDLIDLDLFKKQEILNELHNSEKVNALKESGISVGIPEAAFSFSCPFITTSKEEKPPFAPRIDAKGNTYLCQIFDGIEYSLGNVNRQSLHEILASEKFEKFINHFYLCNDFKPACKKCVFKKNCGKGCIANSANNGSALETDGDCELRQISKKYINKFVEKNDFIKNFPEMEKTMLGKINDLGIELSGGQWQKLAISRALVKPETKILIMDEPVASLDPKSENDLYENFDDICQKKSLILISHRLGVTRLCDKIIVMKEGRIIEQGSHNQLMAVKGEYYKMFTAQQQFYK